MKYFFGGELGGYLLAGVARDRTQLEVEKFGE